MQDLPPAADIVAAVAEFIRADLLPKLEGRASFDARVAANALDIVSRELALAPVATAEETRRLRSLLQAEGDSAELNAILCERLRAGEISLATAGLVEHLRASVLNRVAVDQPGYATYRRIREKGWGSVHADRATSEETPS